MRGGMQEAWTRLPGGGGAEAEIDKGSGLKFGEEEARGVGREKSFC